jgi:hypothetical protein
MLFFNGDINSDCCILECILSQLEYKSGTDRYELCKTKKGNGSILYGNTWRGFLKKGENGENICRKRDPSNPAKYMSKAMEKYPELLSIFQEFRDYHLPEFEFSHVMMNKNYQVDWHRDSGNIGESVVIAIGDFTGGSTQIMGKLCGDIINLDTHNTPHKFDGSKILHRVEPFEGERYALVFFSN